MASTNDEGDIDDSVSSGKPLIDDLLTEYHWSFLARDNFQFTIPDDDSDYRDTREALINDYPDDNYHEVFGMPGFMITGIRDAIAQYNTILNFSITEQSDNDVDTQLRYGITDFSSDDDNKGAPAYAHVPHDDGDPKDDRSNWTSGDVFFNQDAFLDAPTNGGAPFKELVGTYQYHTILHETGHALGLKHGHEDDYGHPALPADFDSMEFTVMTYRGFVGAPTTGGYTVAPGNYAQTLMMLDIQALQYLYGADFTTQSGDTVYKWDTNGTYSIDGKTQWTTDTKTIFLTIWDGGGDDTYDFSGFTTKQSIDLSPGGWSNLGTQIANLGPGVNARGNVFNALQYQNDLRSLIENAIGGSENDRITGNVAANRLDGGAGADTIDGQDGGDVLIGGGGADKLMGGAGFDTAEYSASRGEDVTIKSVGSDASLGRWEVTGSVQGSGDVISQVEAFRFGNGDDSIVGSAKSAAFSFYVDGRGGDDLIATDDGADTLIGGGGGDTLNPGLGVFAVYGGAENQTGGWFERLADNDKLVVNRSKLADGYALSFFDDLGVAGRFVGSDGSFARGVARIDFKGGAGSDTVGGGLGGDLIAGLIGDDLLFGGEGNDTLRGGDGRDQLFGGAGRDRVETGGGGDAIVSGEGGDDTLVGSEDAEFFEGGTNNDSILGFGGVDNIAGGFGNDTIDAGAADDSIDPGLGVESIDGGAGFDSLTILRGVTSRGVSFFLNGKAGSDGTKTIRIEQLRYEGGTRNDTVVGGDNGDSISGNNGDDVLTGGKGGDGLFGGVGNDTLLGGAGADGLSGGAGNDRLETGGGGDAAVRGDEGDDAIIGSNDGEFLDGGADDDRILGFGGGDNIAGGTGDDTIDAGAGDDTIDAGLGVESVDGGAGFDVLAILRGGTTRGVSFFLNGKAGTDGSKTEHIEQLRYEGGTGADTVVGGDNGDSISGNDGNDVLTGGKGGDGLFGGVGNDTLRGGAEADGLSGGLGNDRLETGGGGDGFVSGDQGDDTIIGSNDAEFVDGGADNDRILAFGGADNLTGGTGNDTIDGGLGADVLNGGDGADRFIFVKNTGTDVVTGFVAHSAGGLDLIDFTDFDFASYKAMLKAVTITTSGADTHIDFNKGDVIVGLVGVTASSLSAADFIL